MCGARCILKKATTAEKKASIKGAIGLFTAWLGAYEANKESIDNFDHLKLETVRAFEPLAEFYNWSARKSEERMHGESNAFTLDTVYLEVFAHLDGEVGALRLTPDDSEEGLSWDKARNRRLKALKHEMCALDIRCGGRLKQLDEAVLFYRRGKMKGLPSRLHLQMILFGYSPKKNVIKKLAKAGVRRVVEELRATYPSSDS